MNIELQVSATDDLYLYFLAGFNFMCDAHYHSDRYDDHDYARAEQLRDRILSNMHPAIKSQSHQPSKAARQCSIETRQAETQVRHKEIKKHELELLRRAGGLQAVHLVQSRKERARQILKKLSFTCSLRTVERVISSHSESALLINEIKERKSIK